MEHERFSHLVAGPQEIQRSGTRTKDYVLELCYDLVYVVIIAELSHTLSENITAFSIFGFSFLFLIIWWAWLNGALYHDLHGNNDLKMRIVTFMQMFAVAAMAVFAHNAIGPGFIGFAWSYTAFLIIITYLWWRTGVHDPDHRPLSLPYSIMYLLATVMVITSIFLPSPERHYFWGGSLFIIVSFPLVMFMVGSKRPKMQIQISRAATISPSMVERFGL